MRKFHHAFPRGASQPLLASTETRLTSSVRLWLILLVAELALFAVSGVASAFRSYLFTVAGERVVARLRATLYGAVIGALLVNYAKTVFTGIMPDAWLFALGALFVLVTVFLPKGIAGLLQKRRKGNDDDDASAQEVAA